MKAASFAAVLLWALGAACASAPALADPMHRSGVALEGLVPPGFVRVDVALPAGGGEATVAYATAADPQARPVLLVTVALAASPAGAEAWLAHQADAGASSPLARLPAPGDEARGDAGFVLFRRANVAVLVRSLRGEDVRAVAAHVDRHVLEGPAGRPRLDAVPALEVVRDQTSGDPVHVRLVDGLVDARVEVAGPGYARRTADGWRVVRTGAGALALRTTRVDAWLRVATDAAPLP